MLKLFKGFVAQNRPSLDIDKIATGETWFGPDALERNMADPLDASETLPRHFLDTSHSMLMRNMVGDGGAGEGLAPAVLSSHLEA